MKSISQFPLFSLECIETVSAHGRSQIGKGGGGTVHLIRHKALPSLLFAMKKIPLTRHLGLSEVFEEIQVHRELRHPNIVRLFGAQVRAQSVYLFLELASKGDLFAYISGRSRPRARLSPGQKFKIFFQVVRAIEYLHAKGVIHRDLKPENVLLDADFNAKICDFGWAIELANHGRKRSLCGTVEYMAPEVYSGEVQTSKTDVWALGTAPFPNP